MNLLGIEIGGTKLQLGLGAGDGRIAALRRLAIVPEVGAPGILAQIEAAAGEFRNAAGPFDAIGIGFGGPVDDGRGVVTKSNQIAGWDAFPLAEWARTHLGCPLVTLQNDADTAALGEALFGAGVGRSPILYVTIGSGIGGGLVVDRAIYRGAGAGAVEIGHLWTHAENSDGDRAEYAPLELIASGWSIGRAGRAVIERGRDVSRMTELAEGDPEKVTGAIVAQAAALGDAQAQLILSKATRALGRSLAHAVTLLAPGRIILGGGVSLMREDLWLDPIREELDRRVFAPFRGTFDVVPAALGEEVVVHGALALARKALSGGQEGAGRPSPS